MERAAPRWQRMHRGALVLCKSQFGCVLSAISVSLAIHFKIGNYAKNGIRQNVALRATISSSVYVIMLSQKENSPQQGAET